MSDNKDDIVQEEKPDEKVSKFVLEGSMARMSENNRRMFIALLSIIVALLINNMMWQSFAKEILNDKILNKEYLREIVKEIVREIEYEQETDS